MAYSPMELYSSGLNQTTPEERLYNNEKKSVKKLIYNYTKNPGSWSSERIEKLTLLADRYQVPFAIKDPTIGQYIGAFTGGIGDAMVFGVVPDKAYVVPGAEGLATAGKVVGTIGSIIAAAMTLGGSTGAQAGVAAGGAAVKGTVAAVGAAKAIGSATKLARGAKASGSGLWKAGKFVGRNFTLPGISRQLMRPLAKGISPALASAGVKGSFVTAGKQLAKTDALAAAESLVAKGSHTEALQVLKKSGASAKEIKTLSQKMFGGNKALIRAAVKEAGLDPKGVVAGNPSLIAKIIAGRNEGTAVTARSLESWIKIFNGRNPGSKISLAQQKQIITEITDAEITTIADLAKSLLGPLGGGAAASPLSQIGIGQTALGAGGLGLISMGNMSTDQQVDPYKDILAQMPVTPTE